MVRLFKNKASEKGGKTEASKKVGQGADLFYAAMDFEASKEAMYVRSERRAWKLVWLFGVLLVASWAAIALMMPLKQVRPYVVQVDKQTGFSQLVNITNSQTLTANTALNQYWLSHYLKWHESYNWYTVQQTYNRTLLYSTPSVAAQFVKHYFTGNTSLTKLWGNTTTATVKLLSPPLITKTNGTNVATIRFTRTIAGVNSVGQPQVENLVATIGFGYQPNASMTAEQRLKNPLGFTVYSYQVNPEF